MSVSISQMKSKLLSLDTLEQALKQTEPLSSIPIDIDRNVSFSLNPSWNHGLESREGTNLVDAQIFVHGKSYDLTKDALLEATSLCGLTKNYVSRTPAHLIEPHLNYWFQGGLEGKEFQLLTVDQVASAFTRATITPFSNVRLLQQAVDALVAAYPEIDAADILVDYKVHHDLQYTVFRLIVPEVTRVITNTGIDDDAWSVGVQVRNSLIGASQTDISGYLFRWWCTNGAIDTLAHSGTWSRKSSGQGDEVYDWAYEAVTSIANSLETHSLDAVQALTEIPIAGEAGEVLRDVFTQYRIPVRERETIIENMVESENLTMYAVMQAVTQAANNPALSPQHVESLMRAGGDLPHSANERCEACRRLQIHSAVV